MEVTIEESWKNELRHEFKKDYFYQLAHFLKTTRKNGTSIYPPGPKIFEAFKLCPFDAVKAVIIGQDPYHGPSQAHGLCFSVQDGVAIPPSLKNIFEELRQDIGMKVPASGNLTQWAKQGVLLLNATLTVEAGKAGSHQNKGWERFTDSVIKHINEQKEHVVFMLWGSYAKAKGKQIDRTKHCVLESGHPSPLSANKGHWFGNRHFSKANAYLAKHSISPINWEL